MRALAPPQMLALFTDIGHTGSDYHTGVVVLSRQRSPPLVEQWGANIMSGEHGSDQRAIGAAIAAMNISERISLLPVEERHGFFTFVHGKLVDFCGFIVVSDLLMFRVCVDELCFVV